MTDDVLIVRCTCGWTTTGAEAKVVAATREHGRRLHNMDATREQVLAMASPVAPDHGLPAVREPVPGPGPRPGSGS